MAASGVCIKNIYFGCSISGGRDHAHVYQDIVNLIKAAGGDVLSELFADKSMLAQLGPTPGLSARETWQRDINWVRQADGIIAGIQERSGLIFYVTTSDRDTLVRR